MVQNHKILTPEIRNSESTQCRHGTRTGFLCKLFNSGSIVLHFFIILVKHLYFLSLAVCVFMYLFTLLFSQALLKKILSLSADQHWDGNDSYIPANWPVRDHDITHFNVYCKNAIQIKLTWPPSSMCACVFIQVPFSARLTTSTKTEVLLFLMSYYKGQTKTEKIV